MPVKKIYTPEQATEALGGLYSLSTLKKKASSGEIPHYGGRQKGGNLRFSEAHLEQILAAAETKVSTRKAKPARVEEPADVVELPSFFKQTSRSRAAHRSAG